MATAALTIDEQYKTLEAQVRTAEKEIRRLSTSRAAQMANLERLESSRPDLARRMAEGSAHREELSTLNAALGEARVTLDGFNGLIKEKQAEYDSLFAAYREAEQALSHRNRTVKFEELKAQMAASAMAAHSLVENLIARLAEMDIVRDQMADYRDLGSAEAVETIGKILWAQGSIPRAQAERTANGYRVRGDRVIEVRNLAKKK